MSYETDYDHDDPADGCGCSRCCGSCPCCDESLSEVVGTCAPEPKDEIHASAFGLTDAPESFADDAPF